MAFSCVRSLKKEIRGFHVHFYRIVSTVGSEKFLRDNDLSGGMLLLSVSVVSFSPLISLFIRSFLWWWLPCQCSWHFQFYSVLILKMMAVYKTAICHLKSSLVTKLWDVMFPCYFPAFVYIIHMHLSASDLIQKGSDGLCINQNSHLSVRCFMTDILEGAYIAVQLWVHSALFLEKLPCQNVIQTL